MELKITKVERTKEVYVRITLGRQVKTESWLKFTAIEPDRKVNCSVEINEDTQRAKDFLNAFANNETVDADYFMEVQEPQPTPYQ